VGEDELRLADASALGVYIPLRRVPMESWVKVHDNIVSSGLGARSLVASLAFFCFRALTECEVSRRKVPF
jgi:hypothetical protein